jgi:hypothetical protein
MAYLEESRVKEGIPFAFLVGNFFYSFIHMCIHCLGHFSPLPPTSLSPSLPLLPGKTCSALISNFVEEKT